MRLFQSIGSALLLTVGHAASAHAATPIELLGAYTAQAQRAASAEQGKAFFTTTHGKEWSCASCHTQSPTAQGKHAATGKAIAPLAPAAHAQRFTDNAKVEKWFRRNCNDVLGRACTAAEKADVMSWLISLK